MGVKIFTGSSVSRERLLNIGDRRIRLFHYAGHIGFDRVGTSELGFVVKEGDGITLVSASEIGRARVGADIVVLSACDSGRWIPARNNELLGLAREFLASGSRTVIGTTEPVNDLSALIFMLLFYESWRAEARSPSAAFSAALEAMQSLTCAQLVQRFRLMLDGAKDPSVRVACLLGWSFAAGEAGDHFTALLKWMQAARLKLRTANRERGDALALSAPRVERNVLKWLQVDYSRKPLSDSKHWKPFCLYGLPRCPIDLETTRLVDGVGSSL